MKAVLPGICRPTVHLSDIASYWGPLCARHELALGIQERSKEVAHSFIHSFVHALMTNFNHLSLLEHLLEVQQCIRGCRIFTEGPCPPKASSVV